MIQEKRMPRIQDERMDFQIRGHGGVDAEPLPVFDDTIVRESGATK